MDVDAYLRRIEYGGSLTPTADTLAALHEAHMLAVPFENLDIHRGSEIVLDHRLLFRKVIERRRGGFCYELNGLFARLLEELGFAPTLLSACVTGADGRLGPEFDHLTLMIELDDRWLVDVGFGDSFRRPLRLDARGEQLDPVGAFRIVETDDRWALERRDDDGTWSEQYRFSLTSRALPDFAPMCRYHQGSPDSIFTRKRVCSLALPEGRVSLSDRRLIVTTQRQRTETEIPDDAQYLAVLRERFGIQLD